MGSVVRIILRRERERERTRGGVIMVPLDQVTASNAMQREKERERNRKEGER